jgi:hypothetical protein
VELERRGIEVVLHIPEGEQGARVKQLEEQIDAMEKERRVLEEGMRYGAESGLRDETSQRYEEAILHLRRNWYITLSLLLIIVFAIFLPFWFMNFEGLKAHGGAHTAAPSTVGDAIRAIDAGTKASVSGVPVAIPMSVIDESKPHAH